MLLLAGLCICVSLALYGHYRSERSRSRLLDAEAVTFDSIQEVPNGTLIAVHGELEGNVAPSPYLGRLCVWWRASVSTPFAEWLMPEGFDFAASREFADQRLSEGQVSRREVFVADADGNRIELEGHAIDPTPLAGLIRVGGRYERTWWSKVVSGPGPSGIEIAGQLGECALPPGTAVTAIGCLRRRPDGVPVIVADPDLDKTPRLTLDGRSPARALWRARAFELLAFLFALAAAWLIYAA